MSSPTLERRVEALEAATGGDGGCDGCVGTLIVVCEAISGELHSASWNGEPLDEAELHERAAETRCPKCGRKIDPDETPTIRV